MNIDYARNKEIDRSLKIGARAFAVGAVLILVLSLTGMPNSISGDAPLDSPFTSAFTSTGVNPVTASDDPSAQAGAGDAPAATAHIDVPFSANQGDVEELPAQF